MITLSSEFSANGTTATGTITMPRKVILIGIQLNLAAIANTTGVLTSATQSLTRGPTAINSQASNLPDRLATLNAFVTSGASTGQGQHGGSVFIAIPFELKWIFNQNASLLHTIVAGTGCTASGCATVFLQEVI